MKVIGIDPGINNIGWAVLEQVKGQVTHLASGKIITCAKSSMPQRLAVISFKLEDLIHRFNPTQAIVEETFININAKTSLILSHARGGIITTLGRQSLPLVELAPNKIKKTIVGNGKADKSQVMKMLKFVIPNVSFNSNDEADAIAIAYAGLVNKLNML